MEPAVAPGIPQPPGTLPTDTAAHRFSFNPLTAVHGEFVPGAAAWKPDQRSRRERAIERNESRAEVAERVRMLPKSSMVFRVAVRNG